MKTGHVPMCCPSRTQANDNQEKRLSAVEAEHGKASKEWTIKARQATRAMNNLAYVLREQVTTNSPELMDQAIYVQIFLGIVYRVRRNMDFAKHLPPEMPSSTRMWFESSTKHLPAMLLAPWRIGAGISVFLPWLS